MKRHSRPQSSGFTIVELSLAMTMMGVLLIILVISTMNFVSIYNKGITLKRVNQSGANIGEELQANLSQSNAITIRQASGVATGVCTGNISFVWSVYGNGNGASNSTPTIPSTYTDGSMVYFAKVKDARQEMCNPSLPSPDKAQSTELLGDGLVVRDPSTATNPGGLAVVLSPDSKLVTVIYTISTNGGDDILSDGTNRANCQGGSKDNFCALNTFVVTVYARGLKN
jgi:type II secretory pathway pseudopilin PulG